MGPGRRFGPSGGGPVRLTYAPVTLDAGTWTRFTAAGHLVYMRVDRDRSRVVVRYGEAEAIRDLGVICELDHVGTARVMINPQQASWADRVQSVLLERARVLWRRRSPDQAGRQLTHQAGTYSYDFWPDRRTGRVELYRRPTVAGEVAIEVYLGHVDQFGSSTASVRLTETERLPNEVLCRVQALARRSWSGDQVEQQPVPGERRQ